MGILEQKTCLDRWKLGEIDFIEFLEGRRMESGWLGKRLDWFVCGMFVAENGTSTKLEKKIECVWKQPSCLWSSSFGGVILMQVSMF